MQINNLIDVRHILGGNNILISFSGKFSQALIEELGEAVKKYLENEETPRKEIFNVLSIFIEQTQNIKNYSSLKVDSIHGEKILHSGIVTIGKEENGYFICSGNMVEKADSDYLKHKVDHLITLNKEELKKLYKETLRQELPPDSNGAGLGLIDIARKASDSLEYSIKEINENLCFFSIKAVV